MHISCTIEEEWTAEPVPPLLCKTLRILAEEEGFEPPSESPH
jgi:hypothetical protein